MSLEILTAFIPEDWYDFDDMRRAQVPPMKNLAEGIRMAGPVVPYVATGTALFISFTALALKTMFGGWSTKQEVDERDADDEQRDHLA